jgi:hypothetical protein
MMNETNENYDLQKSASGAVSEESMAEIVRALRGLRFGSVHVVVQDGIVIQVDRTEKRRIRSRS